MLAVKRTFTRRDSQATWLGHALSRVSKLRDQGRVHSRTCFMLVVATPEAITAEEAAWAGIQLDFAAQLKPRVPDEHFKGAKMKYGFVGGGSVRAIRQGLRRCGMP